MTRKCSAFITLPIIRTIICSLVLSHTEDCPIIWSSASKSGTSGVADSSKESAFGSDKAQISPQRIHLVTQQELLPAPTKTNHNLTLLQTSSTVEFSARWNCLYCQQQNNFHTKKSHDELSWFQWTVHKVLHEDISCAGYWQGFSPLPERATGLRQCAGRRDPGSSSLCRWTAPGPENKRELGSHTIDMTKHHLPLTLTSS